MMKRLLVSVFLCLPYLFTVVSAAETGVLADSRFISLIKKIQQKSKNDGPETAVSAVTPATGPPAVASDSGQTQATAAIIPVVDEEVGIPVGEELLLGIYVAKYYLSDVFAYKNKANARISLSNFFEVLDFPIEVDLEKQTASGWFINEGNSFALTFNPEQASQAVVNGEVIPLAPDAYSIEEDDLYVDADVLNYWFGTNMEFDFNNLTLVVTSKQPLPIEQRLEREKRQVYTQETSYPVLPWKENSYRAFSTPLFDVQLNSRITKDDSFHSYSVLGSHDLAYLNSQYFMSGIKGDTVTDLRWKLSKESPEGGLLGPLDLTGYQFGDISPINTGIDYNASLSRGLSLSSGTIGNIVNNKININGDIQPGWDVELYRNGILIDRQISLQSGRYEFNEVDLVFGNNIFEMVLYGPQGQVEKSTREVFINQNSLKGLASSYGVSLTQSGKSLFGVSNTSADDEEGWLLAGRYNQGVTDWFSFSFGHSSLIAEEGDNLFNYTLGANMTLFERLLLDTNIQYDQDDNHSLRLSAKTGIGAHSFDYSYREDNFSGSGGDNNLGDRSEHFFRMSGHILRDIGLPINYQNQFRVSKERNGQKVNNFSNQISINTHKTSISNALFWQDIENPGGFDSDSQTLSGQTRIQRSFGKYFTRLETDYTIDPEAEISRISSEVSWALTDNLQSEFELEYFPDVNDYRSQWGLNWKQDAFNLTGNIGYDQQGEWTLGLFLRFSLGYETDRDDYFVTSRPLTHSGALIVRVFEDLNANGRFDEGEPLVEGAKIKGVQNRRQAETDEKGMAMLQNMPTNITTDIELREGSLDDPFLIPGFEGVSITPRRGFVDRLDFPVVTSSEVEGTVYIRNSKGEEQAAPYVTINLLDGEDKIVATTETEYDGYYLFTDLRPGNYRASIDPAYIERKKLHEADELAINLTAQGDVINGSDFTLDQLEFTSGYVVSVGSFSSLDILKTYWYLLQKRYRRRLKQPAFFIYDDNSQKYQLNLAFYQESEQAEQACELTSQLDINCTVQPYEFSF
ncbi:sporulation protein [Thalassomonas haliotis]|uniref:Sporulation protein n=1 Tax=Thalassomonas haliotis TaxID=485448 RepID=A0ABY7VEH3_9GAMM|nr:sporulation protein [Thalassomonas haliotis]WDE12074.1 sporulation protein [Thalassomonas haliotis]